MSDTATLPGAAPPSDRVSLLAPLQVRNFRNLWLGQSVSLVGDQFTFVALSWLVLSLTGRPGALGSVLMLLAMIGMASVFSFGYAGATYVGLPVFVKGPLGAGPRELGALFAASALGALMGGMIGGTVRARRRGLVGIILIGAVGALLAAVSLAQMVWQRAALLFGSGALLAWIGITYMTMIQQRAERAYMGRVMGMLMFGIYGLYPLSYGLAGWISQAAGVRLLFILGGALILASALLGVTVKELRALD